MKTAVRRNVLALLRKRENLRDLAIINLSAARLNREARDVLSYQIPL